MEALRFIVELEDRISAPAKAAAAAVSDISAKAKRSQASAAKVADGVKKAQGATADFGAELKKAQEKLEKLRANPKAYQELIKAQKTLREEQKKLAEGPKKHVGFFSSFTQALPFRNVAQYTQAHVVGELMAEGVMKAGELLIEAAHKVVEVITDGFKEMVNAGIKQQNLGLSERLSLGDNGAKEFREDAERIAKLTNYDDDEIRKMLLPLRRAGLTQKQARTRLAAATDVEAGGGFGAAEAMSQFENLALKGGVGIKQLVGMGVNAPAFYKSLAKKLGVSEKEAEERAGQPGKVDPELLFDTIAEGIEAKQGGRKLGSGGIAKRSTLGGVLKKIKELPDEYFKQIGNSPAFASLTQSAEKFLAALSPDSQAGARIFARLESMFATITGWITNLTTDKGMDSFITSLEGALDVIKGIVSAVSTLVDLFGKAFAIAEKLVDPLKGITGGEQQEKAKQYLSLAGVSVPDEVRTPELPLIKQWAMRQMVLHQNVTVNGAKGENAEAIGRGVAKGAHHELEKDAQKVGAA